VLYPLSYGRDCLRKSLVYRELLDDRRAGSRLAPKSWKCKSTTPAVEGMATAPAGGHDTRDPWSLNERTPAIPRGNCGRASDSAPAAGLPGPGTRRVDVSRTCARC
jgi:hypothetical protein